MPGLPPCRPACESHSIAKPSEHGGHERGEDRGDSEQVSGRDAGERDVPQAVADQGRLPLDEKEPDGRSEQTDDRARRQRESHELEVKHDCVRGRATGRAGRWAGRRR